MSGVATRDDVFGPVTGVLAIKDATIGQMFGVPISDATSGQMPGVAKERMRQE
jgi:hypothetical protein